MVVTEAARQLDHGQFGDQDSPGGAELMDHSGVVIEDLLAVGLGSPGGRDAPGGEKVLGAVGDAVQQPAVTAGADLPVGGLGLLEGALARDGDNSAEPGPDPLQPVQGSL